MHNAKRAKKKSKNDLLLLRLLHLHVILHLRVYSLFQSHLHFRCGACIIDGWAWE